MDLNRRIRHDLLNRLRWNVLGDLDNISIARDSRKQTTYLPFFDHPAANESLADPPLSRIEAFSHDILMKEDMELEYDEEDRYKPPANLSINNEDGRPITLRQFITEANAYLNQPEIMEDIKNVKALFLGYLVTRPDGSQGKDIIYGHPGKLPEDVEFFFWRAMVFEREGTVTFDMWMFLDGEFVGAERFWVDRLRRAYEYEQERQA
jgi:hypothetical protein